MSDLEQVYELLPTHEDSSFDDIDSLSACIPLCFSIQSDLCLLRKQPIYRRLRAPWHSKRGIIVTSLLLLLASALLFTVDLFYLRGRTAVDYETKTRESLFSYLWPVGLPNRTDSWENENSKTMHALFKCVSEDSCRENQTSVVLLSSHHFSNSISGKVSGEDIWCVFHISSTQNKLFTHLKGNECGASLGRYYFT